MEKRKPILVKLPPALLERLDTWRTQQAVPPPRTAVIEKAIEAFIDVKRGGSAPSKR